jgi:hypothetical protein
MFWPNDTTQSESPTPRGFEPLRAEPNGFLVHLLNHSDTVSHVCSPAHCIFAAVHIIITKLALQMLPSFANLAHTVLAQLL